MERIYKKICLERSRSRQQGLVPFIKYGESGRTNVSGDTPDGNWGGFPYNPDELVREGKTYMDVMLRYFKIWKQIRNGIWLKRIVVDEECDCAPVGYSWTEKFEEKIDVYSSDYEAFNKDKFYYNDETETYFLMDDNFTDANSHKYILLVDDVEEMVKSAQYLDFLSDVSDWKSYCLYVDTTYLGKIVIPESIQEYGPRVPRVMSYADVPQYINWMNGVKTSNDCCLIELWKERGGQEFTDYLQGLMGQCESAFSDAESLVTDDLASIPTIDVMISLTQNSADEGAFTAYDETWYDDFKGEDYEDRDVLHWPYAMSTERKVYSEEERFEVPSYLPDMMHTPFLYDDNRIMIIGQMKKFDGNDGFFECTYYVNESKEPSVSERVVITYELDGGGTMTTTIDKGCTQEERSAWPQNPDTYQIVAPKLYNGRVENDEQETTGEYAVGQTYNGHTITESKTYITRTYATYGWWEAVKTELTDEYEICDGMYTTACRNEKKYRLLTMLEDIDCLVPSEYNIDDCESEALNPGDVYYFLVTYDNGPTNPQETTSCDAGSSTIPVGSYVSTDIPFDVGVPLNLTTIENTDTFIGDAVLSADIADGKITLEYVIGGIFDSNKEYQHDTGTLLEETHNYYPNKIFYHTIDGVSGVPVYCNYIDFESDKKKGISSYNGLSGMFNTSIVKEMPTGDVWTSPSGSIRSVIFKEDYLLGVSYEPETDINVSYDNGTATAWEKHFKLSECNTFQDVENYGNNYFNLQ